MQLLLIRHGQSEADLLHVHEGRADFHLTELGHQQALAMAERVQREWPPERIFASPLKRAHETAVCLSNATGVPVELKDLLMEFNNGKQAGLPIEEGNRLHPVPTLLHEKIEGGETDMEFRMRAELVLSELKATCQGHHQRIAIVAHGGMIDRLLRSFLGLPNGHHGYFRTGDTGLHLLEWGVNDRRVVHFLNRIEHAPEQTP